MSSFTNRRGEWNRALSDLEYFEAARIDTIPASFIVHSGFSYFLKRTINYFQFFLGNNEDKPEFKKWASKLHHRGCSNEQFMKQYIKNKTILEKVAVDRIPGRSSG